MQLYAYTPSPQMIATVIIATKKKLSEFTFDIWFRQLYIYLISTGLSKNLIALYAIHTSMKSSCSEGLFTTKD